jgi:hypothetical protein
MFCRLKIHYLSEHDGALYRHCFGAFPSTRSLKPGRALDWQCQPIE